MAALAEYDDAEYFQREELFEDNFERLLGAHKLAANWQGKVVASNCISKVCCRLSRTPCVHAVEDGRLKTSTASVSDSRAVVRAATTQILLGPPGSEIDTAGFRRADVGDGQRLWNLAPSIQPEDRGFSACSTVARS